MRKTWFKTKAKLILRIWMMPQLPGGLLRLQWTDCRNWREQDKREERNESMLRDQKSHNLSPPSRHISELLNHPMMVKEEGPEPFPLNIGRKQTKKHNQK